MDGTPLYAMKNHTKDSLNTGASIDGNTNMHDHETDNSGSSPTIIKPTSSIPTEQIIGLNFANFNQDYSCISVGYENGFRIYNCDPFTQCYEMIDGSIGIVEMLFCSSLLAIVGTGENPALSPRRLKIINTKRHTTICELTFPTSILSIRMNRERLIVLLEEIIYIYDITNMRLLHTVEIPSNPTGLVALSIDAENNYLAYPSPQKTSKVNATNSVNLQAGIDITGINGQHPIGSNHHSTSHDDLGGLLHNQNDNNVTQTIRNGDVIIFDCKSLQPITVIDAHKTQLAAMAFSHDGTLLATASDKGTIVRVFSVETGVKLYQFRRGTYNTKIYSLAFSPSNMFLVASSATGTVHVFRLGEEEAKNTVIRSSGSSGWLNHKKNENDKNLEAARQNELDKLMKSRQERLESLEEFDFNDTGEEDVVHDVNDFSKFRICHSDSEDDVDTDHDEAEGDDDDDVDEYENVDELPPLLSDLNNTGASGSTSIFSSSSGGTGNNLGKSQPIVDSNRRSVARLLRRTSQSLGRKAAEKMGTYLPPRFSSILEPNRHFASFKVPMGKENMAIVGVLETTPENTDAAEEILLPPHLNHVIQEDNSSTNSQTSGVSIGSKSSRSNSRLSRKKSVNILVVSADGVFYTYGLNSELGGDCVLLAQRSLVE